MQFGRRPSLVFISCFPLCPCVRVLGAAGSRPLRGRVESGHTSIFSFLRVRRECHPTPFSSIGRLGQGRGTNVLSWLTRLGACDEGTFFPYTKSALLLWNLLARETLHWL